MNWLLVLLPIWLQAQPLKPGIYRNLKPTLPLVLDTGSYTFINLEMKNIGKGIWLDGRKTRSLTLLNCIFEGNGSGTGVVSSGTLEVRGSRFTDMACGISTRTNRATTQTLTLTGNTFTDLNIAIDLQKQGSEQFDAILNFTLKCNTFENTPQTGSNPITRKGLVIGEGVAIQYTDQSDVIENTIGGSHEFGSGRQYPNANVWPTAQEDRSERTEVNGIEQDLHDPTPGVGWPNSSNWLAIDNQSGETITYWRYDNEFVGWGSAISGTVDRSVPSPVRKIRTFAQTQLDPSDPNYVDPLDNSYDEACGTTFDEQPVLFPARIALIDSSSTFTGIKATNLESMMLGEAIPNPAAHETRIGILLPGSVQQAVLQFVDLGSGKVLQTIPVEERGKLEAILDLESASSGVYGYRLIVDGKPIGTRKLVVVK